MFHGYRMVLKRRMEIGHCGMAGIACLGKQAEVGEPQLLHQPGPDRMIGAALRPVELGVLRQENDQNQIACCDQQKYR